VHFSDPTDDPDGVRARRFGDALIQRGGEGAPGVQDFCLGEIALARGTGVTATTNALADVLDLQHRLPLTWAVVRRGEAEVFLARRVAKLSRHLPAARVGVVDAAVSRVIAHEAGGRVIAVATHPGTGADELRAIVFGFLARPAELLQLLLEHTDDVLPGTEGGAEPSRATAFPADLLEALRSADLSALAPTAVLHVHLHEAALAGADTVARVEGLGPAPLSALCSLLGRTKLTVRPVRDLSSRVRSTAYEHPESLEEHVYLTTGGDYWPFATSTSRRVDYDHPTPYADTGPPDQTGSHNSGPLGRRHHRWKTHAGYRSRQCGDGRYVWLTPHGLAFVVDHLGTRRIDPAHGREILEAPAGVDLYFA
jgi:hypothetical protein